MLNIGEWTGKASFTIVLLDDYEVVLGQEFMRTKKKVPIPHAENLAIFSS
jgi:hypothetical protein